MSQQPQAQDYERRAAELSAAWQERTRQRQVAQVRRLPPVEVELPDGEPVLAVRAPLLPLLEAGRIPDALTPYVLDLLAAGKRGETAAETFIAERWQEWVTLLDAVWLASVVAPTFTASAVAHDGAIPVRLVSLPDKIALFNWAQGVDDYLDSFRDRSGADARAASAGDDLPGADPGDAPGDRSATGAVAVVADQPGLPVRRARRRSATAGNATGDGAGSASAAEGDGLPGGAGVDLSAGDRRRTTAGRDGAERQRGRGDAGSGPRLAARRG